MRDELEHDARARRLRVVVDAGGREAMPAISISSDVCGHPGQVLGPRSDTRDGCSSALTEVARDLRRQPFGGVGSAHRGDGVNESLEEEVHHADQDGPLASETAVQRLPRASRPLGEIFPREEPWRRALAEEFAGAGLAPELRWSLEWLEDRDAEPTAPPA